jgi:membrane-associated phospholipid phosphatase
MAAFILLVPCYIFIGVLATPGRVLHAPELALDRALPLVPFWALVYGALYLFLILLPIFVVRQEALLRRLLLAYLMVWLTAYAFFILYPTVAPRPAQVPGTGFPAWGLRTLYGGDPPYNCFPSLHVAHSFVSALACGRIHRRVGAGALFCATLVALSTLLTKQHYLADVIAGILLAAGAYALCLRAFRPESAPATDRSAAPDLALGLLALLTFAVVLGWGLHGWLAPA